MLVYCRHEVRCWRVSVRTSHLSLHIITFSQSTKKSRKAATFLLLSSLSTSGLYPLITNWAYTHVLWMTNWRKLIISQPLYPQPLVESVLNSRPVPLRHRIQANAKTSGEQRINSVKYQKRKTIFYFTWLNLDTITIWPLVIGEWASELVSVWVSSERARERVSEHVSMWMSERVSKWECY